MFPLPMSQSMARPVPFYKAITVPVYTKSQLPYYNQRVYVGNQLPTPKEDAFSAANLAKHAPCLVYVHPPRMAVAYEPRKEELRRYHVYVASILRLGAFAVKTEAGVRVVYMTTAQALHFLGHHMIGTIAWLSLSADNRARINQFHKQS